MAGYAWLRWRENREPWLPRIAALEILCVLLYSQWYLARYYLIGIHLPILLVVGISILLAVAVFLGGWLWDRWRTKKAGA